MIPQISGGISNAQITFTPWPSRTFRRTEEHMAGIIDGVEAIKQAIYHILGTERYSHVIYDGNYGASLEQYIGRGYGFFAETIENTVRDALLQDDRISDVSLLSVEKSGMNASTAAFSVFSTFGTFDIEGEFHV